MGTLFLLHFFPIIIKIDCAVNLTLHVNLSAVVFPLLKREIFLARQLMFAGFSQQGVCDSTTLLYLVFLFFPNQLSSIVCVAVI